MFVACGKYQDIFNIYWYIRILLEHHTIYKDLHSLVYVTSHHNFKRLKIVKRTQKFTLKILKHLLQLKIILPTETSFFPIAVRWKNTCSKLLYYQSTHWSHLMPNKWQSQLLLWNILLFKQNILYNVDFSLISFSCLMPLLFVQLKKLELVFVLTCWHVYEEDTHLQLYSSQSWT